MPSRVVDLSLPITPADRRGTCRFEPFKTLEQHQARITLVTFDTHLGTHLDAPSHQLPIAPTLDQLDLAKCVGPAEVLDLRGLPSGQQIAAADLRPFDERIFPGGRVILRTDWSQHFGSPRYTAGYPALTVDAAEYLVERQVVLVGVDVPSVAPVYQGMDFVNAVHEPLLRAEIVLIEGLANLASLTGSTIQLVALPLNLVGLDGCPVRAIAIEP